MSRRASNVAELLVAAAIIIVGGCEYHTHHYHYYPQQNNGHAESKPEANFSGTSEAPSGYQPIKYETLQPDPDQPAMPIPRTALDMQDRKVFVQGFMLPPHQQTHIKEFILCPMPGSCAFCRPDPEPTEMIRVKLAADQEMNYTTYLVRVAGWFRVEPDDPSGIPYAIECEAINE